MSGADTTVTAVVLSGGGAHGAYEVGVLKALASGRSPVTRAAPFDPDIFTGTSVGSLNAAFLASQWDEYGPSAVGNLERFWLEHLAGNSGSNGVFRIRADPRAWLDARNWINAPLELLRDAFQDGSVLAEEAVRRGLHLVADWGEPLGNRLAELADLSAFISTEPMARTLQALDYVNIRRTRRRLKVAATNWATGQLRVFWNKDMTDEFGPVAIRASAAVPGIFPPVEFGSQPFVDGGVLMNTPLSPAIHAGATTLHVIYLDPDIRNIPLAHVRNTYSTLTRMMQISWAQGLNDDIGDAARINRGLAAARRGGARGPDGDGEVRMLLETASELERRADPTRRLRPLTIYRYHPVDPLGGGELSILNFERPRIEALIERGFQDALNHDAAESGDILPAADPASSPPSSGAPAA